MSLSNFFFIVNAAPIPPFRMDHSASPLPESASPRNDNSAGKMKKNLSFLQKIIYFFPAEKIKYLTMTDAKLVWMPDTFFR